MSSCRQKPTILMRWRISVYTNHNIFNGAKIWTRVYYYSFGIAECSFSCFLFSFLFLRKVPQNNILVIKEGIQSWTLGKMKCLFSGSHTTKWLLNATHFLPNNSYNVLPVKLKNNVSAVFYKRLTFTCVYYNTILKKSFRF